jgi:anaerobic carbon-monoxide dehydrogenase iron sulfur subunit
MKCMTTCSTYNFGATSFTKSRIHMIRHEGYIDKMDVEDDLIFQPIVCQQCDKPYCSSICPAHAIQRNMKTGAMEINYNKCIGCKTCILACPFGVPLFDKTERVTIKCDFCDGDPQCVAGCEAHALEYLGSLNWV